MPPLLAFAEPGCRRIPFRDWGVLVGRLFLRTLQRADAVHAAMQCRLFRLDAPLPRVRRGNRAEWCGVIAGLAMLTFARWLL